MTWPSWITGYAPTGEPHHIATRWGVYASHLRDYMHRWIVRTPWGELRLHHILRRDEGVDPHDHAWDFSSLILSGGYTEEIPYEDEGGPGWETRVHLAGAVVRHKAADLHTLIDVCPNTWTLVLAGPKVRSWGFRTPTGWVPWRVYCGIEGHKP